MVADIEPEGEEDVVPDEHLHLCVLPGVDGHDVAVDDGHRPAGGGGHEVAVHLEDGPLSQQPLRQGLPGQLSGSLELLVPVARLAGNVLLVAWISEQCQNNDNLCSKMTK